MHADIEIDQFSGIYSQLYKVPQWVIHHNHESNAREHLKDIDTEWIPRPELPFIYW